MIQLRKVFSNDWQSVIRACYAEDSKLLATFNDNAALGLDAAVLDSVKTILNSDASVYRVELPAGALMGWMAITRPKQLNGWYIRQQCRTPELLAAFNTLVQQTFSYSLFNSTGVNNIDPAVLAEQDHLNIAIPGLDYTGKNFVILETAN